MVKLINTNEFLEVDKAVVVFSSSTCSPCKMVTEMLKNISIDYPNVSFYRIYADLLPEDSAVDVSDISVVPEVRMYRNGELFAKFVRDLSVTTYRNALKVL